MMPALYCCSSLMTTENAGQISPLPLPPFVGIRVKSCAKAVAFDHPYELQWLRPHFGKMRASALSQKFRIFETLPTDKSGFFLNPGFSMGRVR